MPRKRRKLVKDKIRISNRSRIIGWLVLALVLGLMVSLGWSWRGHSWNGKNRAGVLVQATDGGIGVVMIQEGGQIGIVQIGPEVMLPLVEGFGYMPTKVVEKLSQQQKGDSSLVERSLEQVLSVAMVGVIHEARPEKMTEAGYLKNQILWGRGELHWWDRWRLWRVLTGQLAPPKVVSLEEEGMVIERLAGDGVVEKVVDKEKLRIWTSQIIQDALVMEKTNLRVAVVNATSHRGLARRTGEWLAVIGYDVVSADETTEKLEQSKIVVKADLTEQTEYLSPINKLMQMEIGVDEKTTDRYRGDVVIFLGEDWWKYAGETI